MIRECTTKNDLVAILSADNDRPVFIFKHSTICPISTTAWEEFSSFVVNEKKATFWRVLVLENRELSLEIATRCQVVHESPQVILINKGQTISSRSHDSITENELKNMLAETG